MPVRNASYTDAVTVCAFKRTFDIIFLQFKHISCREISTGYIYQTCQVILSLEDFLND